MIKKVKTGDLNKLFKTNDSAFAEYKRFTNSYTADIVVSTLPGFSLAFGLVPFYFIWEKLLMPIFAMRLIYTIGNTYRSIPINSFFVNAIRLSTLPLLWQYLWVSVCSRALSMQAVSSKCDALLRWRTRSRGAKKHSKNTVGLKPRFKLFFVFILRRFC